MFCRKAFLISKDSQEINRIHKKTWCLTIFPYLAKYIERASLDKICCSKNLISPTLSTNNCRSISLREKCPNTEFFLVRIFLYSDWIRITVVSPNTGKYGSNKISYLDTFHAVIYFIYFSNSSVRTLYLSLVLMSLSLHKRNIQGIRAIWTMCEFCIVNLYIRNLKLMVKLKERYVIFVPGKH